MSDIDLDNKWNNLRKIINLYGGSIHDDSDFEYSFTNDNEIRPSPISWDELDSRKFPEDRWIVKDLIPKEGVAMVASVSGEGKSLILLHMAKCISEGIPLFGNPELETIQRRVLYINLEMSLSEMQRRGRMIGFKKTDNNLILLNEDDFNLNRIGIKENDIKYRWLLDYIYNNKINVIIVDTMRPATGGIKEDSATEVRKFFQKFQALKNAEICTIFAEHLRKPTLTEGKMPRKEQVLGSQDKVANLEVLIMIKKNEADGIIHVHQVKNRIGIEMKPFGIKIVDVETPEGKRLRFDYAGDVNEDVGKKEEAKYLIMEIIQKDTSKTTNEILEITKQKKFGQKNVRQALRELTGEGKLDMYKSGKQNTYFLPKEESLEENSIPVKENDSLFDNSL